MKQEIAGRHRLFSCICELLEASLTVIIKCMHVLLNRSTQGHKVFRGDRCPQQLVSQSRVYCKNTLAFLNRRFLDILEDFV
jgi:hypothetical protein